MPATATINITKRRQGAVERLYIVRNGRRLTGRWASYFSNGWCLFDEVHGLMELKMSEAAATRALMEWCVHKYGDYLDWSPPGDGAHNEHPIRGAQP